MPEGSIPDGASIRSKGFALKSALAHDGPSLVEVRTDGELI